MNAHTAYELKQLQSLPLELKISATQQRIKAWYDHYQGEVYLSFSGGKDSTVLRDIIQNTAGVWNVPSVFVDTGLEYPEVRRFAAERADVVLRPSMRFDEVVKKYGYPVIGKDVSNFVSVARNSPNGKTAEYFMPNSKATTKFDGRYSLVRYKSLIDAPFKISSKCCTVMKKKPAKKYVRETGKKPIMALMAEESERRRTQWIMHGCNGFDMKEPRSAPMSFWTEQDVLQYIKERNLPIASVYGEIIADGGQTILDIFDQPVQKLSTTGVSRTGCMFCMFGAHLEKEPNRFQRMKITHPAQYEYCMKDVEKGGLGLAKVLDFIGVKH